MFLKLLFLALTIVVLFSITLIGSFYGFQTFYELHSQLHFFSISSACDDMNKILSIKDLKQDQMENAIGNEPLWTTFNFEQRDEEIIEQCLQGDLPVLSSYQIPKKMGFLQGVGDHDAKGKSRVIVLGSDEYLRLENFEISYDPVHESGLKIPELHVYLNNEEKLSPEAIDLGKLKTNLGGKNYRLPNTYPNDFDTVLIYDIIHKEVFAKIELDNISLTNLSFIKNPLYETMDDIKKINSPTKIESSIIYERHGFFEGTVASNAKGSVNAYFEEDEGLLQIEKFEISNGRQPELYLTTNGNVKKNWHWTFGPDNNLYVASSKTNEILRYDGITGKFKDAFVSKGSGGLDGPRDLTFSSDNEHLLVSSFFTNEILRYDGITGKFKDAFVSKGSGGLDGPRDLTFSSDNEHLLVSSFFTNEILRYDGITGKFKDAFVSKGSGGLDLPTGLTFGPDNNLYVASSKTNEILRYDGITGKFKDAFVSKGSGGLDGPRDLTFSSDNEHLLVSSFFTNEILRYDRIGTFEDAFITSYFGGLDSPNELTFGPDNNLYVASSKTNEILRYDGITGKFKDAFVSKGSGGLDLPTGLTFGPDNNLYVASSKTNEILRYDDITGKFKDAFVSKGSGGLDGPRDLTFSSDNEHLLVSSFFTNEILRYDGITGEFLGTFDSQNNGGLDLPIGLVVDSDSNVYVVSSKSDKILKYSPDGEFQNIFVSGPELYSPTDLSFYDDSLYVSSNLTHEILRYDVSSGTFLGKLIDRENSSLRSPTGLTFGPDNNLYVASSKTNEILRYDPKNEKPVDEKFVTDKSNGLNSPTHLEIKNKKICVSSNFNKSINCYHQDSGEILDKHVLSFGNEIPYRDNSIIGPDGVTYVSNNLASEIVKLEGTDSELIIETGDSFLRTPSYLTFKDGYLYVGSDDKIFKFDGNEGGFIDVFVATNDGSLRNPQGLLFTNDSLLVNSYNDRILQYDFQGKFVKEFTTSKNAKIINPVGMALDEQGNLFTTSQQGNILKYSNVGVLEKTIPLFNQGDDPDKDVPQSLPDPHGLFLDTANGVLYINVFNKNTVLQYDVDADKLSKICCDDELLDGPEDLAFDKTNEILYISSNKNHKIIAYEVATKSFYPIIINTGDGELSFPKGIFFNEDDELLYIANSNNNEILQYDPQKKSLNIFSKIVGGSITTGGITFGSDQNLYVINEDNNDIYRYDVNDKEFIDVFIKFENSLPKSIADLDSSKTSFNLSDNMGFSINNVNEILKSMDDTDVSLKNIIFTNDNKFLFASDPFNDRIFVYNEKGFLHHVFADASRLEYPTDIALTPDEKFLLVSNYGTNTISRLTITDGFLNLDDALFVEPGKNNLTEIKQIGFDPIGNLYVAGGKYNHILKYTPDGDYLGEFNVDDIFLSTLSENLLKHYTLNGIDTRNNAHLVVYDNFLEQPIAQVKLNDTVEILTPIDHLLHDTISLFNIIDKPELKSTEIIKHTGFFAGNNTDAYGQVITKNVDQQLLIKIEEFSISYDKHDYASVPTHFKSHGPQLTVCLSDNTSNCIIAPKNDELKINAGDNMYMLHDVNLDDFDPDNFVISISEGNNNFAYIPLKEYGIARISLSSFIDWFQHYLPVFPFIGLIMIFPIIFDYVRSIFKLLFFPFLAMAQMFKKSKRLSIKNDKITILIPAHNEESGIKEAIESALATDYPNKEIIVIDDGSNDDTYLIAHKFDEQGLIKLIHRDTASGSKATALNYGANYATGEYIICMDGDTKLDKNSLKNAIKHFDDEKVVALSGNVKIISGDDGITNTVTRLQSYEYMVAIELGRRFTSFFQILLVISGAFGVFKKNFFRGVGAFDKYTLTEDFDLTLKLRKTKHVIRFVGDSMAYTYCPNTLSMWKRQRNRWAYGQFQTLLHNSNILFKSKSSIRDKLSFLDMFVLDILLALLFPIGLVVLGIVAVNLYLEDNLHVLVYPLFFVMMSFLMVELLIFLFAVAHSTTDKLSTLKFVYLAPVMTFFYRPYLKMINLRAYVRAYLKKRASW